MEKKLNDEVLQDVNGGGNVSGQNGTNNRSQWAGPSFNIGDKVYFEAPIESLQTEYLVKSKEIQINKTKDYENIFYVYVLTNTFNGENAINYFDNQRRKNSGNMEEGQFITRYVDVSNECNIIFDNLQVEEETTNELSAELDIEL